MEVYLEIEDVQYGRMVSELFENLTESCLDEILNLKHEEDEMARLIGRYTEPSDELNEEEGEILREHGFNVSKDEWSDEEKKMFSLIDRIIKPGDKLTESEADMLRANGYIIENNEIMKFD